MAYTAHKDAAAMKEHFDEPDVLSAKVDQLVTWIKAAKHFTVFTGAGVSTSAGIPDFRGPDGVWTLQAQGKQRAAPTTPTTRAVPTATHMSLVALQDAGVLKYLISQNCDGLHRRSGMRPNNISELHGNSNIEECESCGKQYLRDFAAHRIGRTKDHYTGRHCVAPDPKAAAGSGKACGGRLLEYTIDFGQNLPEVPLAKAYENARASDLCLVLGSSLTVSPANEMPKIVAQNRRKNGGKLVICNLQKTPLYNYAALNIHAKCDVVMRAVMERLQMDIPGFVLRRKINVSHEWHTAAGPAAPVPADATKLAGALTGVTVRMNAVDVEESSLPATMIHAAGMSVPPYTQPTLVKTDPFVHSVQFAAGSALKPGALPTVAPLYLNWFGHYNEPALALNYPLTLPGTPWPAAAAPAPAPASADGKEAAADAAAAKPAAAAAAAAGAGAGAAAGAGAGAAAAKQPPASWSFTSQYLLEFRHSTSQWTVTQLSGHPDAKSIARVPAAPAAAAAPATVAGAPGGVMLPRAQAQQQAAAAQAAADKKVAEAAAALAKAQAAEAAAAQRAADEKVRAKVAAELAVVGGTKMTITATVDAATAALAEAKAAAAGQGGKALAAAKHVGGLAAGGYWGTTSLATDVKDTPVLVCVGGLNNQNSQAGAISVFDLNAKTWKQLGADAKAPAAAPAAAAAGAGAGAAAAAAGGGAEAKGQAKAKPVPYRTAPRWGHSASVVPGVSASTVWLIGGWDSQSQFNDVYAYDVKTDALQSVDTTTAPPPAGAAAADAAADGENAEEQNTFAHRAHHSAVVAGDNIIVFGGSLCRGGPYHYYNDTWRFHVPTKTWHRLQCRGDIPAPRAQHTATLTHDGTWMLVVGGDVGGHMIANTVHALHLPTLRWFACDVDDRAGVPPLAVQGLEPTEFRVTPARHSALLMPRSPNEAQSGVNRLLISGLCQQASAYVLTVIPNAHDRDGSAPTCAWRKLQGTALPLGCTLALTPGANAALVAFGGQRSGATKDVSTALHFAKISA